MITLQAEKLSNFYLFFISEAIKCVRGLCFWVLSHCVLGSLFLLQPQKCPFSIRKPNFLAESICVSFAFASILDDSISNTFQVFHCTPPLHLRMFPEGKCRYYTIFIIRMNFEKFSHNRISINFVSSYEEVVFYHSDLESVFYFINNQSGASG